MVKKQINQNSTNSRELLDAIDNEYLFDKNPINRLIDKKVIHVEKNDDKIKRLEDLKSEINSIKNCKLVENAKQIIFGDGNINSPLMIIGGAPGVQEDIEGKIYIGEDGKLLEKMLMAINIKKIDVYKTYAVNFRPPDDRKPTSEEIKRYSVYIQKHISIIKPQLLILMGSTAMESLTGLNSKISLERGQWKETIIRNITYTLMITFDPSYLLRVPENKKYSWEDLKKIKDKIKELNLKI